MFFKLFTNNIYIATELTLWVISLLSIYINWREYKFIENVKERPVLVRKYMDNRTFQYLRGFNMTALFIAIFNDTFTLVVQVVFSDELSHLSMWNYSSRIAGSSSESMVMVVFIAVTTCKDFLLMLPMRVYSDIKLNKESLAESFMYMFAEFCIEQVSQILLLSTFVYIYKMLPHVSKNFMIYTITVLLLGTAAVLELALDSFFNSFLIPMEDPIITEELKPFLDKMKFPKNRIYLMKMDKPTDMPNAFTLGSRFLKNERIVVADNILGKNKHLNDCCTQKEVVSIILHELGHVYYNHTIKSGLIELFITLSTSMAFIHLHNDHVFQSFGFVGQTPAIVSILIRMDMLAGYNVLCAFFNMLHLRHCEYQADYFSSTFSKKYFRSALTKIHLIQPKDLQTHDRLYSVWNLDHPSLVERLEHLEDT